MQSTADPPSEQRVEITLHDADSATDALVAINTSLHRAVCDLATSVFCARHDEDAVLLEALFGVLRARAAIRETLDRVAVRGVA